jgi:hypothetical protein
MKEFNVTGICLPDQHYIADISGKYKAILQLIEKGKYFTMNRPRQFGKTTALFQLETKLRTMADYIVFRISFEGVGDDVFRTEADFAPMFLDLLMQKATLRNYHDVRAFLQQHQETTTSLKELSSIITQLATVANAKMVLFIDEIDKSSNNQIFVSFLGMLRDKYLARVDNPTFHAVVLAGVHDVKSLKLKLRPNEERKYNSPWNIAADFKVKMELQPAEIMPMLQEYARDRSVAVEVEAVAERLFYYTSGYPFLVSKLCKIFDEELLPDKKEQIWTTRDVDAASRILLKDDNTNFQELLKNLRHHPDLYDLVSQLLLVEQSLSFNIHSEVIQLGLIYGIFAENNDRLVIHNRIYREMVSNYMIVNQEHQPKRPLLEEPSTYLLSGNRFDVRRALLKFQELMKAEYNPKDRDFLERQGRLVFLAFLKPILNGHGNAVKEPQISEEKRLDVLINYHQHQYVIELKRWYGEAAHQKGLDQLAAYLDSLSLEEGALLIFDHSGTKQWKQEEIEHGGKRIFAVWA